MGYRKYKDISGKSMDQFNVFDQEIIKLASLAEAYAEKKYTNDKKLALDVVENLARTSPQFNDISDFDTAFETLEAADDRLNDSVSQTLLDNMRVTLEDELQNFQADKFITEGIAYTKETLKNLGPKDVSENIIHLTSLLDTLASEYKDDASKATQASLDYAIQDVVSFARLKHMFNFKDDDVDDEIWRFEGEPLMVQDAYDLKLAGDIQGSEKLMKRALYSEEKVIWENIGKSYQRAVKEQNQYHSIITNGYRYKSGTSDRKVSSDTKDWAMFKYLGKMPTVGLQSLNTHNFTKTLGFWANNVDEVMRDSEILWNRTDEGLKLKAAYDDPDNGGIINFNKVFEERAAIYADIPKESLTMREKRQYLYDAVWWVPDQSWMPFSVIPGENEAGGEVFFQMLNTYLLLLQGHEYLSELTGVVPSKAPENIESKDPINWENKTP